MTAFRLCAATAALAIAAAATPAAAEVVTVTFSSPDAYFGAQGNNFSPNYSPFQQDYMEEIGDNGHGPMSFTFSYDTAAVAVGGRYDIDLVDGSVNGYSNFGDFDSYASFQQAGSYLYLNFFLEKVEVLGPNTYRTFAVFNVGDNDGSVVAGSLPSAFLPRSEYAFAGASFETYGQSYLGFYTTTSSIEMGVLQNGAVPEPSAWALLILGFGAVGAGLRRGAGRFAIA